jgi:hypothetical protein
MTVLGHATPILVPETHRTAPGINEHWCEHPGCRQWGGRGYSRGKGQIAWLCFEHCAEAEAHSEVEI